MFGGIYNETTRVTGSRSAGALHLDTYLGPWNVQREGVLYDFNPKNPPGVDSDVVTMAGFQAPFQMAAKGRELTFNIARAIAVGHRFLETVTCYGDMSRVSPQTGLGDPSTQIVTGCLLQKGGFYTYVDWITGRNMWFAGGPGIGLVSDDVDPWKGRLNVNVAYYF